MLANREIAPGVHLLRVARQGDFKPGQVVGVALEAAMPPRLYSIASGTCDEGLELLFDVAPEGLLSPRLARLRAGDSLLCSPPFGTFTGGREPAWWIATGTGVAPFRSMLRSGLGSGKRLIHGARTAAGFYFADEFDSALGSAYVRCCSGAAVREAYPGRLTAYLAGLALIPRDIAYFLCGSAEMVTTVRDFLLARGVPYGHILSEIYF